MHFTKYLLLSLFLVSSFSIYGQGKAEVQLTSIKLSPKQTQSLKNLLKTQLYNLDKRGILRPTKGHHILYHKPSRKVIVKPTRTKTSDALKPSKNFDAIEVMGYIFACGGCRDGSCVYGSSSTPGNGTEYHCIGNCKCIEWIMFDPTDTPAQYETPDGNYNSGWDRL